MRFIFRSFAGLFFLSLTLVLLILAGEQIFSAMQAAKENPRPGRPARERVFTVAVGTLSAQSTTPHITAYGTVGSANSFEIRASSGGALVALSPDFRDGGQVEAGAVMLQIDPARAQTTLELAQADLADARTDLEDARGVISLTTAEQTATQNQLELRQQALERQKSLQSSGASTGAAVETAALAVAASELALLQKKKTLAQAQTRILRAEITVQRREISVREAERSLAETKVFAPFDGLLLNVSAVPGRLVTVNERLGELIDPTKLEIAFRISSTQFSRLLDRRGKLKPLPVSIRFEVEDFPLEISGVLDRASAEVGEGQTGRLVYAMVNPGGAAALRPGDFVTVSIAESPLENVAVIPASAVSAEGLMLVLGADSILEEIPVQVLRYQADNLIISGAPIGREYVLARTPQIGGGVKVEPLRDGQSDAAPATRPGQDSGETVAINAAQRAKYIAQIEANSRMPAEAKARILTQLEQDEIPARLAERLDSGRGR